MIEKILCVNFVNCFINQINLAFIHFKIKTIFTQRPRYPTGLTPRIK